MQDVTQSRHDFLCDVFVGSMMDGQGASDFSVQRPAV